MSTIGLIERPLIERPLLPAAALVALLLAAAVLVHPCCFGHAASADPWHGVICGTGPGI